MSKAKKKNDNPKSTQNASSSLAKADKKVQKVSTNNAKGKGKTIITSSDSMADWISKLVAKETSNDALLSKSETPAVTLSKEERIQKRAAKKRRREERKMIQHLSTSATATTQRQKNQTNTGEDTPHHNLKGLQGLSGSTSSTRNNGRERSKVLLKMISASIVDASVNHSTSSNNNAKKQRPKPYYSKSDDSALVRPYKKLRWDEHHIQPRKNDYGGIGLARPTLFLSFDDPSFTARLEEEFMEHIPGFFGKQRTKAMKKQLGKNMLWRKLFDAKNDDNNKNMKIGGKKLSDMTPDERVEAMIKTKLL